MRALRQASSSPHSSAIRWIVGMSGGERLTGRRRAGDLFLRVLQPRHPRLLAGQMQRALQVPAQLVLRPDAAAVAAAVGLAADLDAVGQGGTDLLVVERTVAGAGRTGDQDAGRDERGGERAMEAGAEGGQALRHVRNLVFGRRRRGLGARRAHSRLAAPVRA